MRVHLLGPGGAGKTTVGQELALLLGWPFHDLDQHFLQVTGDISRFIDGHGYQAYATRNIETYIDLRDAVGSHCVIAVSSGFMIYPAYSHPHYLKIRQDLTDDGASFLLLPSFDLEACVSETVRRQISRSYLKGNVEAETRKIRQRFSAYAELTCQRVETSSPPSAVARKIAGLIAAEK